MSAWVESKGTAFLRTVFALVLALTITGCVESKPKLDATSVASYQASLVKMKEDLAPDMRSALDEALISIAISTGGDLRGHTDGGSSFVGFATAMLQMMSVQNPDQAAEAILKAAGSMVDGKTADEIIRLGQEKDLARLVAQLSKLEVEMAALPQQIERAERAREEVDRALSLVRIEQAQYYWAEDGFLDKAIIDFKISNGLSVAIAGIFIEGVLETPGRSVPWVDSGFNYMIRGGLEPGETQHLKLAPNMFGDWSNESLKGLTNTMLTLRVVDVETAAGERFARENDEDAGKLRDRLRELEKSRAELQEKVARAKAKLMPAS